jgi:IclR family KDG regulon transcriptional repressor
MEYPQYSPKTILDRSELEEVLDQIQSQGYYVAEEDYELSTFAIGAPIRDHTGQVVAAVSVAIPQGRYNQELKQEKLKLVLSVALRLSEKLGYRDESDLQTME